MCTLFKRAIYWLTFYDLQNLPKRRRSNRYFSSHRDVQEELMENTHTTRTTVLVDELNDSIEPIGRNDPGNVKNYIFIYYHLVNLIVIFY